jgi:EAL domain-containing protein (putative c-di-GMP-specific phosphodiesterase class I)
MAANLVAQAKRLSPQVFADENGVLETEIPLEEIRLQAAKLLAAGFHPKAVATAMKSYLSPTANERSAYHKLNRWRYKDKAFRDLIYEQAVLKLDLNSPDILDGIRRSARRGRVDAARFALELTGRHVKEEQQVTQVNVVLNNIARPQ